VAIINALGDGHGVISDYHRTIIPFQCKLFIRSYFLILHVIAMLENIVTVLGGKMTIMKTLFVDLE